MGEKWGFYCTVDWWMQIIGNDHQFPAETVALSGVRNVSDRIYIGKGDGTIFLGEPEIVN